MVKNLISILVTDYIQKRRGQALLFSFEYNLLPNLISNFNHYMDRAWVTVDTRLTIGLLILNMYLPWTSRALDIHNLTQKQSLQHPFLTFGLSAPDMCYIQYWVLPTDSSNHQQLNNFQRHILKLYNPNCLRLQFCTKVVLKISRKRGAVNWQALFWKMLSTSSQTW